MNIVRQTFGRVKEGKIIKCGEMINRMDRRRFIKATGACSIAGIAGCISNDNGYGECYGDCEKVESININSEEGWGDEYTELVISFEERFTGNVVVKTYDGAGEVNGVREADVNDVIGYTAHFDSYKTEYRYKVFLEEDG